MEASIAVNGCCLTVVDWGAEGEAACDKPSWWEADVTEEKLRPHRPRAPAGPATPSTSSGRCACRTASRGPT